MARAVWSGVLSFGLVSVPVELYTGAGRHKRRRPDRGVAVERGGGQEEIGRDGTRQEAGPEDNPEDNRAQEDSTKRIGPESGGLRETLFLPR
jgi:hypothetical protein